MNIIVMIYEYLIRYEYIMTYDIMSYEYIIRYENYEYIIDINYPSEHHNVSVLSEVSSEKN